MNRFVFCLFLLFAFLLPGKVHAGDHTVVTGVYNVNGVCDQCKRRIEDAAYVRGVKFAEWNVDSHALTVKYDSSKTSYETVLKSIARAGHDNELLKATDEDYNKLPKCCLYRSGIKKH